MRWVRLTYRAAWLVTVLSLLVILGGAFVRASRSGAGCGDEWPTCHGQMTPALHQFETFVEWSHRATSGLVWIAALLLYLIARKGFAKGSLARTAAGWSFVFMCTEALVGAALVLLELVADNASIARAFWVSGHLLNTFLLLGALTLTLLGSRTSPTRRDGRVGDASVPEETRGGVQIGERDDGQAVTHPAARRSRFSFGAHNLHAWIALVIFVPVGCSGAIAALGDTLFPAATLWEAVQQDISPTAHFLVRLRVLHPLMASLGAFFVLILALTSWKSRALRPISMATILLLFVQSGVGFAAVALLAPIPLQLLHLFLADLLWMLCVTLAYPLVMREVAHETVQDHETVPPPSATKRALGAQREATFS